MSKTQTTQEKTKTNKCQSTNAHFGLCELKDKKGNFRRHGVGKYSHYLSYYLKDDPEKTEHEYLVCDSCASEYEIHIGTDIFDEQIIRLEKFNPDDADHILQSHTDES